MAEGGSKHIKIEYETRKVLIPYRSHDEFIKKCKERFKIGPDEEIAFTIPGDDTEIDSDCISDFPSNTHLQLEKANSGDDVSGSRHFKKVEEETKNFKIEYETRKVLIPYRSHEEFIKKCKGTFRIEPDEEIFFTNPGDDTEIDSECFSDLQTNTHLQLQKSKQCDLEDTNQCSAGGNESSSTGQTSNEFGSADYEEECRDDIETFKWGDDMAVFRHLSSREDESIANILESSLQSWKMEKVNVAIIGQSGKGKSSLINALRGIFDTDSNAAKVGEVETTKECTPFPHPKYANIVYWDVPGCGTKDFPQASYLYKINYEMYDFFLIVSTERFNELDIWLAKKLVYNWRWEKERKCYFIRSKVDIDIANRKRRETHMKNEKDLFQKIKTEVKTAIAKDSGNESFSLFLLSSHYPERYEFQDLQQRLIDNALTEKRLSLAFGMNGLAQPLLDIKQRALRSRQWKIAAKCSSELSSTTVFKNCIERFLSHIMHEIQFYKEQLSLDYSGLEYLARISNTTVEKMRRAVDLKPDKSRIEIKQLFTKRYTQFEKNKGRHSIFVRIFKNTKNVNILDAIRSVLDEQLQYNLKNANTLIQYLKSRRGRDEI